MRYFAGGFFFFFLFIFSTVSSKIFFIRYWKKQDRITESLKDYGISFLLLTNNEVIIDVL